MRQTACAFVSLLLVALLPGCANGERTADVSALAEGRYITDEEARLILTARQVMLQHNSDLEHRVYHVRPEGDGWIVESYKVPPPVRHPPGVQLHSEIWVRLDREGRPTELTHHRTRIPLTPPD